MTERKELIFQIDGMSGDRDVEALRRAMAGLDPDSTVEPDLDHGRATIITCAEALVVAETINQAGYRARAMTL